MKRPRERRVEEISCSSKPRLECLLTRSCLSHSISRQITPLNTCRCEDRTWDSSGTIDLEISILTSETCGFHVLGPIGSTDVSSQPSHYLNVICADIDSQIGHVSRIFRSTRTGKWNTTKFVMRDTGWHYDAHVNRRYRRN